MKPDLRAAAISHIALTVFRLNGELLQWGDRLVEPLGLTSARWQMLGAVALADSPLSAPQVGQAMGVTRQGAQKQLNLLLDQGLLESRPNPAHKRARGSTKSFMLNLRELFGLEALDIQWHGNAQEHVR